MIHAVSCFDELETVNIAAIYRFHPDFRDAGFPVWWGDPDKNYGLATAEGGDVMPIGNRTVLIGMGERTTPQAVGKIARSLFEVYSLRPGEKEWTIDVRAEERKLDRTGTGERAAP